jgi:hypothetical protein
VPTSSRRRSKPHGISITTCQDNLSDGQEAAQVGNQLRSASATAVFGKLLLSPNITPLAVAPCHSSVTNYPGRIHHVASHREAAARSLCDRLRCWKLIMALWLGKNASSRMAWTLLESIPERRRGMPRGDAKIRQSGSWLRDV